MYAYHHGPVNGYFANAAKGCFTNGCLLMYYNNKGDICVFAIPENGKLAQWESNPCQAPSCANRKKFNKDKTICLFSAVIRNVPNILMRWWDVFLILRVLRERAF